jgi:hypothetical protein
VVPAATLLLKLTVDPSEGGIDWSDLEQIAKLRIVDLASRTGTLLTASVQKIVENHVRARAEEGEPPDLKGVHKMFVEKALWSLDVVPFAIDLAGSALALYGPNVEFGEINLWTLPIRGAKNKLGSLEVLRGCVILTPYEPGVHWHETCSLRLAATKVGQKHAD